MAEDAEFLTQDFCDGIKSLCARVQRSCGEEVNNELLVWCSGAADADVVTALTECARAVRNLCVNSDAQQILATGVLEDLINAMRCIPRLHESSPFPAWQENTITLGRVLLQALANLCVGNSDTASKLWRDGKLLNELTNNFRLGIMKNDLTLLRNLVSLLYSIVLADAEPRAAALTAHESAAEHILHSAVLAISAIEEDNSVAADLHANLVWLTGELVNAGSGPGLFEAVDKSEQAEQLKPVLASLWLGHRLEEENIPEHERDTSIAAGMEVSFDALTRFYLDAVREREDKLERSRAEQLALRALGSYAQDDRVFVVEGGKRDLLHGVLTELNVATTNKETVDYGVRVDLLRVIANACYRRTVNQDHVREFENGLYIILNNCNVDERSPFLREWGIVAIRNLCEGNEENQRMIADLRVQGTVQTSLLDKAGLRVELDAEGKPKVVPNKVSGDAEESSASSN